MDVKYPIGKFEFEGDSSQLQRDMWIAEIRDLPKQLREAVAGLSEEQKNLPYREGGWTIRQVVHHLADSHMNSFIRFKLALTEENPTIKPYFEDRWAELQDTIATDVELSLNLLESLHQRWVILLNSMNDMDYTKQFYHPESKRTVRLDYNLGFYAWHGKHHVAHITNLRKDEMEANIPFIESVWSKFVAERKWFIQCIEQLDEEDINWAPTADSNSIANLVSHIRGTVHSRIEILLLDIPDTRERDKEFEKGLQLTKQHTLQIGIEAFDLIIQFIERMKDQPQALMIQPYLEKQPLTHSAINNQSTAMNMLVQMVREIHFHTGQIIYIAKMRKGKLHWTYDT